MEWFGSENYYLELQQNMVFGETERNKKLLELSAETGVRVAFTGNVHYHMRERHQLQDCLVAIKHCKSLEESHRERQTKFGVLSAAGAGTESSLQEYPEALTIL